MPEKKRIRKKWDGKNPVESIDEAIELLETIRADLKGREEGEEPYYDLIGIKVVYDVEE